VGNTNGCLTAQTSPLAATFRKLVMSLKSLSGLRVFVVASPQLAAELVQSLAKKVCNCTAVERKPFLLIKARAGWVNNIGGIQWNRAWQARK